MPHCRRQVRRAAGVNPRESLSGDDLHKFEECQQHVESLGFEPDKAELYLKKVMRRAT